MTFQESVRVCFTKYADFRGTASRSEYWWFVLFLVLAGAVASVVDHRLGTIFFLATLLPLLAAGTRRLRDTGRSGWLQLFGLVPVAGIIVLAVFLAQEEKERAKVRGAAMREHAAGA
jgi:uncharacterized membrane protein YhaH (DUF805 family)